VDQPVRSIDLLVDAGEAGLERLVRKCLDVSPVAAGPQVDLADRHRAGAEAVPLLHEVRLGERVEDESGGRIELAGDDRFAVGWQRDGGFACHVILQG